MKAFIGLGSNLGDRRAHLERAAVRLGALRASPILETPALVPAGAPMAWRALPFLNAVVEIEWSGSPRELLVHLKSLETEMGRVPAERWAPRLIDLDILTLGDLVVEEQDLQIPHPEISRRDFVLSALKHLAPTLLIAGQSVLQLSRRLGLSDPLCMGIVNLTEDSFSDGGQALPDFVEWERHLVSIFDLGAESTRPGAFAVDPEMEWARLAPVLERLRRDRMFAPWVSVDTYHTLTAVRAIEAGADWINDVSGLHDPRLLEVLAASSVQYVLMHSLSVPADPRVTMAGDDVVTEIYQWAEARLERLVAAGVSLDRVLFDPGLGFGKTALQSARLVQEMERFLDLPVRLLVGHSRKSFLDPGARYKASERDCETLGVSLQLANKGVDVLRVHSAVEHRRVLRAYQEAR